MAQGRVVWFNSEKGYGFIATDHGGPELFVHHSSIQTNGDQTLQEGQRVSFAVEQGAQGPRAVEVTPVNELPPRASVDRAQQVRRARLLVVVVLAASVLLVLVVAYALLAPSAGWWSPSWLPLAVGVLIAAAYAVGKLNK
jgi:CspA family cold shock protein